MRSLSRNSSAAMKRVSKTTARHTGSGASHRRSSLCFTLLRRESSRHGVSGHIGSRAKPALRTGTKQLPLCGMGLPRSGFKFVVPPSGGFLAGTAGEFRLKAGLRTTQPEMQPQASLWVASKAVDLRRHHSSTTFVVSTLTSLLLDHSRHNAATEFF